MNKILAFHAGRIGDVFIGTPSFELLREKYPDSRLFINIHKDYQDIAPLLYNQRFIDGIFISNEYENFPDELDHNNLKECGFDLVFNPMQKRRDEPVWWMYRHQVSDISYHYGLLNDS